MSDGTVDRSSRSDAGPSGRGSSTGLPLFFASRARRGSHLAALDGLRGIAVAIVLLSHLSNARVHLVPGLDLAGIGKSGVFLFFVLSAFLLARGLLKAPPRGFREPRLLGGYFARRFLRIAPLYSVVLVAHWAASRGTALRVEPMDAAALWRHLSLRAGVSVYWAIPVEVSFYAVLPGVAFALALVRRYGDTLRLIAIAAAALAAALWIPSAPARTNSIELAPYLSAFLIGVCAAVVHRGLDAHPSGEGRASRETLLEGLAITSGLALLVLTPVGWANLVGRGVPRDYFHDRVASYALLWSIFLIGSLHGRGFLRGILSWKPLRWLGIVSFSLYLWHLPILNALVDHMPRRPRWEVALVVLAASSVVAALSYLAIERPFLHSAWVRRALARLA